nr:hypothetical protein CTI12_AA053730 [Tanacetum cinerariifolium]
MGARSFASILSGKIRSQKEVLAGTITKSITLENSDLLELSDISNVVLAKSSEMSSTSRLMREVDVRGVDSVHVDSFEEGDINGDSVLNNDGCVNDYMKKNLDDDVEKDIEDCRVRPVKAAVNDSSIVTPSTPPVTDLNLAEESCSTWLDYVGPLITNELDSEKRWNYRDPYGNFQGPFSIA